MKNCRRVLCQLMRQLPSRKQKSLLGNSHFNYPEVLSCSRCYGFWSSSKPGDWNKVVSDAEKIVGYPTSFMSLRCLLSDEISNVAMHMRKLVGTKHPLLKTARGLVYDGKHSLQIRGLIVLLISKAAGPAIDSTVDEHNKPADQDMISGIYPSQRSLAEITEMIHTANLIHKGVVNLDDSSSNGSSNMKDMEFGNKMAILSGDFLLANACTGLAELNNTKVVEMISSSIGDLMEAEFTTLRDSSGYATIFPSVTFSDWLTQTFLSTGSLLAKSCQSALELASHSDLLQQAAFEFGKNMAYAYQMNEDLRPFLEPEEKVHLLSVVCAPVVRHMESLGADIPPELLENDENIDRKKILSIVKSGTAIQECANKCVEFGQAAMKALDAFPLSESRQALKDIVKATTKL